MADTLNQDQQTQLEQMVETLEQILEVMPEDLSTLQTLYETYIKLEKPQEAFEYLDKIADFAVRSQHEEAVRFALQQYQALGDAGPEIEGRKAQLQVLLAGDASVVETIGETPEVKETGSDVGAQDLEAEMALAWDLFQDEQLTQEEYSNVLHDLTEMSSRAVGVPVTVLHVLHDRQFSRFERLITHLCEKSEVPIVSLSSYEENEDLRSVLPEEFPGKRGVLPFASVGDDLLVAVLNPFDKTRLRSAESESGRACHPYLVAPDDYDRRLDQLRKAES